jgi:hypothetical protein
VSKYASPDTGRAGAVGNVLCIVFSRVGIGLLCFDGGLAMFSDCCPDIASLEALVFDWVRVVLVMLGVAEFASISASSRITA